MGDVNTGATFADGVVASPSSYNAKVHQETATAQTSFAAVNGRLDDANFKAGEQVAFGEVRKQAFSVGTMVGNTLNIDIFKEMSMSSGGLAAYLNGTRDMADGVDEDTTYVQSEVVRLIQEQGIPVLAITWYNPYAVNQVRLCWNMAVSVSNGYFYAEDADAPTSSGLTRYRFDDQSYLTELEFNTGIIAGFPPANGYTNRFTGNDPAANAGLAYQAGTKAALFVDGTLIGGMQRNLGDGIDAYADDGPLRPASSRKLAAYQGKASNVHEHHDMRFWSGALTIDSNIDSGALTKGWHSASIRLITDRRVVRVHCRHMLAHAIR